ncbi:hypothetical protein [Smaragdicoccus niigatensis]|uniref:hypothetical protein n=1 Tax=Smaragdicoccus niigatensis TaxID=359359 RepID=UPI00036F923D|nr:hypothetical protein [Smaragdicoccus niigatensis]
MKNTIAAKIAASFAAASFLMLGASGLANADTAKPVSPAGTTAPTVKKTCTTTKTPIVDSKGFIIGVKTTTTCVIE